MTRIVSKREMNYMRAVQEQLMPDSCDVQRPTVESDGEGGYTRTYTKVAVAAPCRYGQLTAKEVRELGDAEANLTDGYVALGWDHDVQVTDQIVWRPANGDSEVVFEVVGTNKPSSVVTATRARVRHLR